MAALNFPLNPETGNTYAGYIFDGEKWDPISAATTPPNELINGPFVATLDSSGTFTTPGNATYFYEGGYSRRN